MKRLVLGTIFIVATVFSAVADSPLTSTPFYTAYMDLRIIRTAKVKGVINLEMAEYLSSESVSIDLKAALINALSWDINGKNNSELYKYYLGIKYGKTLGSLDTVALSDSELFSLGYLKAMDNYFNVKESLIILEGVREKLDKSLTASLIYALVLVQNIMENQNWESMFQLFYDAIDDKSLKADIRPAAVGIILDYMELYK
ncbi:MAG: hypothetical protein L3J12_06320 [Spirochaetales bacterium]|nr:hypothetical protein [Spirochaetales bacterium]